MLGEWEALLDGIKTQLDVGLHVVYLPATIDGASAIDVDMLRELWARIRGMEVNVLPPE